MLIDMHRIRKMFFLLGAQHAKDIGKIRPTSLFIVLLGKILNKISSFLHGRQLVV